MVILCGDNVPRVLEELARWTAVPELPRLPPLQQTARTLLRREFEDTEMLVQPALPAPSSEAERLMDEGDLMLMTCTMLPCAEALQDPMSGLSLLLGGAVLPQL
jgi:hypothetical protein